MVVDYISSLERAVALCDTFERRILHVFLKEGQSEEKHIPFFAWLQPYQERFESVKGCLELCRILKPKSFGGIGSGFFQAASALDNIYETKNIRRFKVNLGVIRAGFKLIQDEVSPICAAFDEEEKERMNEAIHDYLQDCNCSCVAMSVSAVESRLLKLMSMANLDSESELLKKTLGQLICEYVSNKDKYKNVVPEKHEPLLQLCNTYRTFSVHPKKHRITGRIASSILHLAIEFLVDQDTKPEVVQAKMVATKEGE